jgi:hypothetical protein
MKQLILGDIHGRSIWKDILNKHEDVDRVVFIGDYVDTHESITGELQLNNLLDIIEYKKNNSEKVILLVGNHDYQYWPGSPDIGNYSGFQRKMLSKFQETFRDNKKLFQICFEDEYGTVYSHAGFTKSFVNKKLGHFDVSYINDIWRHSPETFCFYKSDWSSCGNDINQSCIWVRPGSLFEDSIDKFQIIGHTTIKEIQYPQQAESNVGKAGYFMVIDTLPNQYLIREEGRFQIRTNTVS